MKDIIRLSNIKAEVARVRDLAKGLDDEDVRADLTGNFNSLLGYIEYHLIHLKAQAEAERLQASVDLSDAVAQLTDAWRDLDTVQSDYRHQGAADTEPDTVAQHCIKVALETGEVNVPRDPNAWELFTLSEDCRVAADQLYFATARICQIVAANRQYPLIQKWVANNCWRV